MNNPQEFINQWISEVIAWDPSYHWATYIANSIEEIEKAESYLSSRKETTSLIAFINRDDEEMEFIYKSPTRAELNVCVHSLISIKTDEEGVYRIYTIFT